MFAKTAKSNIKIGIVQIKVIFTRHQFYGFCGSYEFLLSVFSRFHIAICFDIVNNFAIGLFYTINENFDAKTQFLC